MNVTILIQPHGSFSARSEQVEKAEKLSKTKLVKFVSDLYGDPAYAESYWKRWPKSVLAVIVANSANSY